MKTRPQQALNSLKQTTILTLMIGQKLEKVYIYPDCNIKAISLSIVQKHNLATEAVYFLEENIRNQLKKLQTSKKSNISQKSSSNTSPRNRQILTARSQIKFYEELYDKGIGVLRKRKEKAEIFKKNQEISMLKEVTFRPKITSYHTSTNKSQISYSPIRNRDISENLYENGLKLMEKKQMSSEKFRDESFKKQCSFKPIICEKSKQIVQGKGNANIKDFSKRLYKIVDHSQWREEKIKEFYPFKPELINKGRIKEKKNNSFRKTIEEKDEEKINHSPKIRKDAYYFKAKQNENDEMLRFSKNFELCF